MNPSFRRTLQCLSMAAAFVLGARGAQAADITGAGSSFVYPLISKWSASYADKTGHRINYQSIGSGGGIAQIKAGTVDFGASDMPLDEATLKQYGLGQFPDAIGGIVPALNVEGVAPAFFCLAELDPLVDEGVQYADLLRMAGVPVELEIYKGVTHEFIKMGRAIPEARQAHAAMAAALRAALGTTPAD